MMKELKLNFAQRFVQFILLTAVICFAASCGDDTDPDGTTLPVSSFQFEISETDWSQVTFSNFSENATSYEWDFGDGNSSTEKSPTHSYTAGGTYTVVLTASSGSDSRTSDKEIIITDPNDALRTLAGESSKTWKLFREGVCMSLGPDAENSAQWWPGLTNNGERPCAYLQEFTFHTDGTYVFEDAGMFWGEFGIFNNVEGCPDFIGQECFEATAANMVNACGDDVSAWLSGTHSYEYDPSTASLTLNGTGAWIGIPKLSTSGESIIPESSLTTRVSFQEFTGYDIMFVEFVYEGAYWPITYVSYSDSSLEPAVETDAMEFGEDLDDISPSELSRTFASADAADFVLLDTIPCASIITYGVANPDGSGSFVGQFDRIETEYQELQMQTSPVKNDINFENLTTLSIDVYLPSANDYSSTLTKNMVMGFGDVSQTEQWWTDIIQYELDNSGLAEDQWHTITLDLSTPNVGDAPTTRNDMDMFFIGFGGGGHPVGGTFYIRNLVIN